VGVAGEQRLTQKELAARLRVSVDTVRRHVRAGSIPEHRTSERRVYYLLSEVDAKTLAESPRRWTL
jgi:excisionase family DNA binding protein